MHYFYKGLLGRELVDEQLRIEKPPFKHLGHTNAKIELIVYN